MASSSSQSPASPVDDPHGENNNNPVRTKRRYGASCELCRRRKRKCPGRDSDGKSLCLHCSEVGVKCVFPPNGSFLRAKKAVAVVNTVSSEADTLRAYIRQLAEVNDQERQRMLKSWIDAQGSPKDLVRNSRTRTSSVDLGEDEDDESLPPFSRRTSGKNPRPFKKPRIWTEEIQGVPMQEQEREEEEEEDGNSMENALRPESALRLSLKPALPDDETTGEDEPSPDRSIQTTTATTANISAWVDYWISIPFPDGITAKGPSPEDRKLLFDNYFCWQGPRNGIVDRSILERALEENDTKYASPFLLFAVCAHTVRHIPSLRERVHEYAAKAHYLLAAEMSRPSSIPTVQGLLLLSSHDAARGMYAQAWNLSSTAVAMMTDLGCHLDKPPSSNRNDPHYRQMRSRLFWAAFIWDKLLSLALNRTPLLRSEEYAPPFPEREPISSELWVPVLCTDSPPALFSYVPQPSHEVTCLFETCRAYQFLDEIHRHLYRTQKMRSPQAREFVADMRERILRWQDEACPEVMFDLNKTVVYPPPPHIMQLNLLIRLIWILLYRPFFYSSPSVDQSSSVPYAVPTCQRAAIEINGIFTLYDRFYPLSRASYIVIFAGFLQATVDLALADREKSVSGATLSRLALAGRVLSGGSANIPGMHSSIERLQEHLHATLSRCNSWVPSSKSRHSTSNSFGTRATSVVSNVAFSPSPPMSDPRSSVTLDSQSDRSSSSISGTLVSPIHDSDDPEPLYPLPQIHTIPRHLSPSEVISYSNGITTAQQETPRNDYPLHLPNSESAYLGPQQNSYIPQTPDMDYMAGSQPSHYESGWSAWFWPGDSGGGVYSAGGHDMTAT